MTATTDIRWVLGLQLICASAPARSTPAVGNNGAAEQPVSCPVGGVAVGTVQAPALGHVGLFGLICADTTALRPPTPDQEVVLFGTFEDEQVGRYSSHTLRLADYLRAPPSQSTLTRCPAGQHLAGVDLQLDRNLVGRIDALRCALPGEAAAATVAVDVGATPGTPKSLDCGEEPVTGMVPTTSGWLESLSLNCGL